MIHEFDPVKALQEIGVNQNEATKQASLKYLDKFGQPASDDFTMWLFIGPNSEKFSQSIIVQFECLHCIENSTNGINTIFAFLFKLLCEIFCVSNIESLNLRQSYFGSVMSQVWTNSNKFLVAVVPEIFSVSTTEVLSLMFVIVVSCWAFIFL